MGIDAQTKQDACILDNGNRVYVWRKSEWAKPHSCSCWRGMTAENLEMYRVIMAYLPTGLLATSHLSVTSMLTWFLLLML